MDQKYSLSARLKAARKAAGYKTSKEFIEKNKIPPSTYSQHETGRRKPNDNLIKQYSKLLNVNFDWLKIGEGDPYADKQLVVKQKKFLQEEMLDLSQWKSVAASAEIINESLLTEILKQLLELHKTAEFPIETIANTASGIYTDIVSIEKSCDIQVKLVTTAVSAFKRYINKMNF